MTNLIINVKKKHQTFLSGDPLSKEGADMPHLPLSCSASE